jgi:hypothetical protein
LNIESTLKQALSQKSERLDQQTKKSVRSNEIWNDDMFLDKKKYLQKDNENLRQRIEEIKNKVSKVRFK